MMSRFPRTAFGMQWLDRKQKIGAELSADIPLRLVMQTEASFAAGRSPREGALRGAARVQRSEPSEENPPRRARTLLDGELPARLRQSALSFLCRKRFTIIVFLNIAVCLETLRSN